MPTIKFEIEVEETEVPELVDMLKDVVQAFEMPSYLITFPNNSAYGSQCQPGASPCACGEGPGVIELEPTPGLDDFAAWVAGAFPSWAQDDEDDETDPCIILPGMVMELDNGLVYQVFSIDATGRVILDVLEESIPDSRETVH